MLPLSRIMLAIILLAVVVQNANGNQKIVRVSELISKEGFFASSGNDHSSTCCVYGNCSCNSLDHALANLTSNVLINITTDMMLSSLVKVSNIENVSIIGHNNPTVNCRNVGGIHFTFCNNCIIQGVTWDQCGTKNIDNHTEPGLMLSYSFIVTIQNCSFQRSAGQAVVLSKMSGDVNIKDCKFVNNSYHGGHGAAIYYSSNNARNSQFVFIINNCNFSYNRMNSLVYLENISLKYNKVIFIDSIFCNNQGISVYAIHYIIYFKGKLLFQNNTAENGAGIYIRDYSTVTFHKNSNVTFIQNTATRGGAVFLRNHSICLFDQNSMATFNSNKAINGTIYSEVNCNVTFKATCEVTFSSNSATQCGAAIYSTDKSHVTFTGNAKVTFSNNIGYSESSYFWFAIGGIIYCSDNSHICFEGNSSTIFSSNIGNTGGAMLYSYSNMCSKGNSSIVFSNNNAIDGGAIYYHVSNSSFEGSSTIVFKNNTAVGYGGAILATGNYHKISFKGNSTTVFSDNTASEGGAIYSFITNYIYFRENATTVFSNNTANYAGAIFSSSFSSTSFVDNSTTEFSNNTANYGGAFYSDYFSNISFVDNSMTEFSNNSAADDGGAIAVASQSDITFGDNSIVNFNNNNAPVGTTVFSTGNSKIISKDNTSLLFNDISAKWCDSKCLPYNGQGDIVTIDGIGVVWCSNQKLFRCLSSRCYCRNLENILQTAAGIKDNLVNISDSVLVLSSAFEFIQLDDDISIIGHNNPTVICVNGGRLKFTSHNSHYLMIEGITWIGCGAITDALATFEPGGVLTIFEFNKLIIQKCSFQYSVGQVVSLVGIDDVTINDCRFVMNTNHYQGYSAVIYYSSRRINSSNLTVSFKHCYFGSNEGAKSVIYFYTDPYDNNRYFTYVYDVQIYLINTSFYNNQGVPIYLSHQNLHINGEVLFENNVAENGAGIYMSNHSTVIFGENSNTKFINNSVYHNGAAIFLSDHSNVIFDNNSTVTFTSNRATIGTIYSKTNSNVTFKASSKVVFSNNLVTKHGTAIYSSDNSYIIFTGNANFESNVIPLNDMHLQLGGTIFSQKSSRILFEENSITRFSNNLADFGAAIFSIYDSHVIFKDRSIIMFHNNTAHYCGALTFAVFSTITFTGHTKVTYNANTVSHILPSNDESSAGAICTYQNCTMTFSQHSSVSFINNRASRGGAVISFEGNIFIEEYSTVMFDNNFAWYSSGGAFVCSNNSNVIIKGNSNVTFNGNKAIQSGGAIYSYSMCKITFKENSTSSFIDNTARNNGGAILSSETSEITFKGNSMVIFNDNIADNGGALYFANGSNVLFSEFTIIEFHNNKAFYGGAILANDHCNISLTENSDLLFAHNDATQSGGAGYFNYSCNFIVQENVVVTFDNNRALHGGAICIKDKTELLFKENSTSYFLNNLATVGGGAVKVLNDSSIKLKDHTTIKFIDNNAQYGGAIFLDTTAIMVNDSDKTCINFTNNIAKVLGSSVYQDFTELCNSNCIVNRTLGIKNEYIATPPNRLNFNNPALCVDEDNDIQCNSYYVHNIMLGTDIAIPACVLDYYNHSVNSIQFLIHSERNPNYFNSGPKEVLISCDKLEGINIIGNQALSKSTNFSFKITLNIALNADWKEISVNLIIGLTPCHPGFWQYPNSTRCECYNANDIVFCSDSSSTIKRNYWFGNVTGKPTVTFCPINYCNFSCCETSNGYYHLSPVRDNQCRLHRSGTACGSCEEGYTLSFDSPECVHVNECSIGQTILVLALTVLYWVVIIAVVFSMMHFKVGIGYLYAITYYYSVVDLLLSQIWYPSNALYIIINVMSGVAKIIPQFLGQICFIRNMSGIDQQFIHYMHPVAISLFLIMITVFARRSRRLSTFISKGIIHVICCLLLLSYTSLATTSLLLMRPLTFQDVDKVYTYVSPDIEYFHGRHLVYAIVAMLFTIVIVIGLPLLLALEPFLNSKINFVKIKPLLDQFQCCYKDKYRYFAAYYMICRLLIITIIIANSSNDFIFHYLLITASVIMALVHQILRPYSISLLNEFDGVILHFLVLVSVLPLVESFDNFNSDLLLGITFVLVILPVLIFITMSVMINKEKIRKLPGYCYTKCSQLHLRNRYSEILLTEREQSSDEDEYVNVIDDSRRINATICDV